MRYIFCIPEGLFNDHQPYLCNVHGIWLAEHQPSLHLIDQYWMETNTSMVGFHRTLDVAVATLRMTVTKLQTNVKLMAMR